LTIFHFASTKATPRSFESAIGGFCFGAASKIQIAAHDLPDPGVSRAALQGFIASDCPALFYVLK